MRFVLSLTLACSLMGTAKAMEYPAEPGDRWRMDDQGGILWNVHEDRDLPHADHIEMSGRRVSVIVDYGINSAGTSRVKKHVVWPMLRTIPNDTHASLARDFRLRAFPDIRIDGMKVKSERVQTIRHVGLMTIVTGLSDDLELTHTIFPSTTKPTVIENCVLHNRGEEPHQIAIAALNEQEITEEEEGVYGAYVLEVTCTNPG